MKTLPAGLIVGILVVVFAPALYAQTGTCHNGYVTEGRTPPVFGGINSSSTGFDVEYWAWGENPSDQGTGQASVVDDGTGLALNSGILWANSDNCTGQISGTGVLVQSLSTVDGGLFALLAIDGSEGNVDALQDGTEQCVAQPIPRPTSGGMVVGTDGFGDYADVYLHWDLPPAEASAVSTQTSLYAGNGVYYRTETPVDTGDKSQFVRVDTTASGTVPYILDDPDTSDGWLPVTQMNCTVRVRPSDDHYFVVSLIVDGSGATSGDPQIDPSAIETLYVSASSNSINAVEVIFADGFESGDTNAWSETYIGP